MDFLKAILKTVSPFTRTASSVLKFKKEKKKKKKVGEHHVHVPSAGGEWVALPKAKIEIRD